MSEDKKTPIKKSKKSDTPLHKLADKVAEENSELETRDDIEIIDTTANQEFNITADEEEKLPESPDSEELDLDDDGTHFTEYTPRYKPGEIVEQSIIQEMKVSYLDYSMSVIVSRALPETRDGLKPSQRRVLVSLKDLSLYPTAHYRKSAKIAADTSGNYHPHGESIVYPTMVKLAQEFSTRYPLVDGQGNFGSIDGDPPAAMRYTEARMTKITATMLDDLEKGTVTYILNYDGTRLEPTVLPTLFPNLLANGSDGIAVGMATKIPPHNLTELVNALREMIKLGNKWEGVSIYNELRAEKEKRERIPKSLNGKPESKYEHYLDAGDEGFEEKVAEIESRLNHHPENGDPEIRLYPDFESDITFDQLIEIIPGPDFPTGGIIYDQKEILNAYSTGRGRVLMRAKASIEESKKSNRMHIVITEIPYQVNKATLQTKIADLVKEKKVEGISDIRDESTSAGIRVVIVLKQNAQPKTVLNKLFKYTQMQMAFNANMIALVDQEPQTLSIKRMLELFLSFRIEVTIRRYEYDLAEARYRGHILEGLLKALDILDEVIATIRASKTQEEAKENLISKFDFTTVQAQAILDMQLRRLAALEREKLQEEYNQISENIKEYNQILSHDSEVLKVVDQDLAMLLEKHGDERRTKVVKGKVGEFSEEDMVAIEETFVTISKEGYIKRQSPDAFKTQKRGGKGVIGATTKEGDFIEHAFSCSTHDQLMLFSNKGRVFTTKVFEIPESSRTAKGLPLVNLVALDQGELITSILTTGKEGTISEGVMDESAIQEGQAGPVVDPKDFKYLFMATSNGTVKKTSISEFDNIRAGGLIAIKLEEGDQLQWVRPTTGDTELILVTRKGRSIRFHEKDVRPTGRATMGVRGIKFKDKDDQVVTMNAIRANENQIFTISEKGYGKMTKLSEYPTQGRGGSGVFNFRVNDKTGDVAVARVLDHPKAEIVVISQNGHAIRTTIDAVPVQSRQTSGVRIMSLTGDDKVAALAIL